MAFEANNSPAQEPKVPTAPSDDIPAEEAGASDTLRAGDGLRTSQVRYDQSWLSSFLRPVLIGVMVACINIAFGAFLQRFLPDAPAGLFISITVMGVLAAIVATFSTAWLAQPGQRVYRTAAYRSAEIALIVMSVRLALWLASPDPPSMADIVLRPIDAVFDGYFLLAILVILLSWFWAIDFSSDLLNMALQADELYLVDVAGKGGMDLARPANTNRQAMLDRFVARWMMGGLILIALAAGSRIEFTGRASWGLLGQSIDPVVISAIIIFFFAGLILISQGQLAILRARWTLERVPTNDSIARNWPFYVVLLLSGIGLLAALLPLGGTLQLSRILTAILNGIYFIVYTFYQLILFLILSLLSLLPFSADETPPPPPPALAQQPPPLDLIESPPFLDWAGGLLFWITLGFLLLYAAGLYFGANKTGRAWLMRLWEQVKGYWRQFFGAFDTWQQTRLHPAGSPELPAVPIRLRLQHWLERLRSGNLTPEQRIRFYYLSMLEQAEKYGAPRVKSETPAHFAPRLNDVLHEDAQNVDAEVESLTVEFERVRYAGAPATPEDAAKIEDFFARIRKAMTR